MILYELLWSWSSLPASCPETLGRSAFVLTIIKTHDDFKAKVCGCLYKSHKVHRCLIWVLWLSCVNRQHQFFRNHVSSPGLNLDKLKCMMLPSEKNAVFLFSLSCIFFQLKVFVGKYIFIESFVNGCDNYPQYWSLSLSFNWPFLFSLFVSCAYNK